MAKVCACPAHTRVCDARTNTPDGRLAPCLAANSATMSDIVGLFFLRASHNLREIGRVAAADCRFHLPALRRFRDSGDSAELVSETLGQRIVLYLLPIDNEKAVRSCCNTAPDLE